MTNKNEHIDNLLAKRAAESLTSEEHKVLEEWIDESPVNASYAEEMQRVWLLADNAPKWQPTATETEEAWNIVQNRISTRPKVIRMPTYWAAAASIILLISVWWLWPDAPSFEYIESGDQSESIILADGSEVILEPHSSFSYPDEFDDLSREVKLTGSAHFTVQGDVSWPFRIAAGGSIVEVVGTQFSVDQMNDSVFVEVEEGIVQLYQEAEEVPESKKITMAQGESGYVTAMKKPTKLEEKQALELKRNWQFESLAVGDVLQQLEAFYQVDFVVKNEAFLSCQLTAKYQDAELAELLTMLELTFTISIERENNVIRIIGKGC